MIFAPLEAIFAPLIDPLVDLISLPDIGFTISVSFEDRSPVGMWLCVLFDVCFYTVPCRRLDEGGSRHALRLVATWYHQLDHHSTYM